MRHRFTRAAGLAVPLILIGGMIHPTPASAASGLLLLRATALRNGVIDAGSTVTVDIWPTTDVLATIPDGGVVPFYAITRTMPTGQTNITVDPLTLPAQYITPQRTIDFSITTTSSVGDRSEWHTSAAYKFNAWTARTLEDTTTPAPSSFKFDLGVTPTVVDEALVGTTVANDLDVESTSSGSSPLTVDRTDALGAAAVPVCTVRAGTWHYNKPEKWLRALSWWGAPMTVDQNTGADHTLGVGFSVGGTQWSANGTTTISTRSSAGGSRGGLYDVYIYNKVNYRDFNNSCSGTHRRPQSFYDLIAEDLLIYTGHTFYGTCVPKNGGTSWKVNGKNITYSTGVTVGAASLSANASFSSENKVGWTFNRPSKLCGSSSSGWPSSPTAEAHPA